jgi:hypothetical protein
MKSSEPLELFHSWPLSERARQFELGTVVDIPTIWAGQVGDKLARHGMCWWECELSDNRLTWSDGVYDIFGVPRGASLMRDEVADNMWNGRVPRWSGFAPMQLRTSAASPSTRKSAR